LKHKVDRVHSDPGTEVSTKKFKEWCTSNFIRRTVTTPEDSRANGSAEAAVGIIKRQTRTVISEAKLEEKYWPFAITYAAKQRERKLLGQPPLLKIGTKVIVKKRTSANRKVKGFEPIAEEATYLGPIEDTDGHYVLTEDQKVMKTSRIVAFTEEEKREESQDLKNAGWKEVEDPSGNLFYVKEGTNEKTWNHPLRLEELNEDPTPAESMNHEDQRKKKRVTGKKGGEHLYVTEDTDEKEIRKKRLNGKQNPENLYVKTLLIQGMEDQDEDEIEGEDEVSKTITLNEVYENLNQWIPSMKGELDSQYGKNCLQKRKWKDIERLQDEGKLKVKILPSKLVAVKKKKPQSEVKLKARLVACGNMDNEEKTDTYAGGCDATAVRATIRRSAIKQWTIRTKDVSTAFLNAPYKVKGEVLVLIPPKVFIKAGLVEEDEVWEVKRAIYGLKEAPLLWAKERDQCLE
jgi:hypothetical protein